MTPEQFNYVCETISEETVKSVIAIATDVSKRFRASEAEGMMAAFHGTVGGCIALALAGGVKAGELREVLNALMDEMETAAKP